MIHLLGKEYNKYDTFLFILVVSVAFGGIGGPFQVVRIVAILLLPVFYRLYRSKGCGYARSLYQGLLLIYLYMLVSFVWTPDKSLAIKELVYFPIHFLLFLEITVFARFAKASLKSISRGWLMAVLLCSAVAFWELTTNNHLSIAYEQGGVVDTGAMSFEHFTASVTFANYNNYNIFLCFSFPWIFSFLIEKGYSFKEKLVSLIALVLLLVVIVINGSRGGMLSCVIMLSIYFVMSAKSVKRNVLFALIMILVGYLSIQYGQDYFTYISYRVSDGMLSNEETRSVIWSNELKVFGDYYGFGTGVGGNDVAMSKYSQVYTSPHNLFLEVLGEFGIIIAFVFICFIWRLFVKSLNLDHDRKVLLMMALIAMPAYGIVNSGYLLQTHFYVLMATIYVYANYDRIISIHFSKQVSKV